jgi:hypothetical protein
MTRMLGKPEIAVGARDNADWFAVPRWNHEFSEGSVFQRKAGDPGYATLAEPEIAVRSERNNIRLAAGCGYAMFANDGHALRGAL